MSTPAGAIRDALADALAASLEGPLPEATPQRVHGALRLPGKVTCVLGVRRAGKTTFVHQMRCERLAAAGLLVPYANFEDEGQSPRTRGRPGRPPRAGEDVRSRP